MCTNFVRLAQALGFVAQFLFEPLETARPMPPIRFAFSPLFGYQVETQLIRIELGCCLGDPRLLRLKQIRQGFGLFLTAFRKLSSNRDESLSGYLLECGHQISDIPGNERLYTRNRDFGRRPRESKGFF
jgi:hypothetical protein